MGFPWMAAAAVGGSLIDAFSTSSANKANIKLAREQMDFQERMRNTEMQARVKDLLAAGLNPMLAYTLGGASTPGGARPEVQPVTRNTGDRLVAAITSAAQVNNLKAQTAATNMTAEKTAQEAREAMYRADILKESVPYSALSAKYNFERLTHEVNLAREQVFKIGREIELQDIEIDDIKPWQIKKMQPIIEAYQGYLAKAAGLKIPQLEAENNFWRMLETEGGITAKALMLIKSLVR